MVFKRKKKSLNKITLRLIVSVKTFENVDPGLVCREQQKRFDECQISNVNIVRTVSYFKQLSSTIVRTDFLKAFISYLYKFVDIEKKRSVYNSFFNTVDGGIQCTADYFYMRFVCFARQEINHVYYTIWRKRVYNSIFFFFFVNNTYYIHL